MINYTKILRVRHSHLQLIHNKLHFKEQLFSGLAYRFTIEGVFIELLMIASGIEVGKSDDLLPLDEGCIRIDLEFEDEFEENELSESEALRTIWKGGLFEGGGFMFTMDGTLEEECIYDDRGMTNYPCRSWYPDGLLSNLYEITGTSYSWYRDGSLSRHKIRVNGNPEADFKISINESKQLSVLSLGTEKSLDNILFNEYGIAENLKLMGKGIRNQELFMIIQQIEKGSLEKLSLLGTSITGDFLLSLELNSVQYITIADDEFITDDDFSALQKKYPECRVVRKAYPAGR